MKPHRMRMTHDLLHNYNLLKEMEVRGFAEAPSSFLVRARPGRSLQKNAQPQSAGQSTLRA